MLILSQSLQVICYYYLNGVCTASCNYQSDPNCVINCANVAPFTSIVQGAACVANCYDGTQVPWYLKVAQQNGAQTYYECVAYGAPPANCNYVVDVGQPHPMCTAACWTADTPTNGVLEYFYVTNLGATVPGLELCQPCAALISDPTNPVKPRCYQTGDVLPTIKDTLGAVVIRAYTGVCNLKSMLTRIGSSTNYYCSLACTALWYYTPQVVSGLTVGVCQQYCSGVQSGYRLGFIAATPYGQAELQCVMCQIFFAYNSFQCIKYKDCVAAPLICISCTKFMLSASTYSYWCTDQDQNPATVYNCPYADATTKMCQMTCQGVAAGWVLSGLIKVCNTPCPTGGNKWLDYYWNGATRQVTAQCVPSCPAQQPYSLAVGTLNYECTDHTSYCPFVDSTSLCVGTCAIAYKKTTGPPIKYECMPAPDGCNAVVDNNVTDRAQERSGVTYCLDAVVPSATLIDCTAGRRFFKKVMINGVHKGYECTDTCNFVQQLTISGDDRLVCQDTCEYTSGFAYSTPFLSAGGVIQSYLCSIQNNIDIFATVLKNGAGLAITACESDVPARPFLQLIVGSSYKCVASCIFFDDVPGTGNVCAPSCYNPASTRQAGFITTTVGQSTGKLCKSSGCPSAVLIFPYYLESSQIKVATKIAMECVSVCPVATPLYVSVPLYQGLATTEYKCAYSCDFVLLDNALTGSKYKCSVCAPLNGWDYVTDLYSGLSLRLCQDCPFYYDAVSGYSGVRRCIDDCDPLRTLKLNFGTVPVPLYECATASVAACAFVDDVDTVVKAGDAPICKATCTGAEVGWEAKTYGLSQAVVCRTKCAATGLVDPAVTYSGVAACVSSCPPARPLLKTTLTATIFACSTTSAQCVYVDSVVSKKCLTTCTAGGTLAAFGTTAGVVGQVSVYVCQANCPALTKYYDLQAAPRCTAACPQSKRLLVAIAGVDSSSAVRYSCSGPDMVTYPFVKDEGAETLVLKATCSGPAHINDTVVSGTTIPRCLAACAIVDNTVLYKTIPACVTTCPPQRPALMGSNPQQCVDPAAETVNCKYVGPGSICQPTCALGYKIVQLTYFVSVKFCYATCPENLIDSVTTPGICVSKCPDAKPLKQLVLGSLYRCVDSIACPYVDSSFICATDCSAQQAASGGFTTTSIGSISVKVCTTTCPKYRLNGECLQTCPSAQALILGSECVATCGTLFANDNNECIACTGATAGYITFDASVILTAKPKCQQNCTGASPYYDTPMVNSLKKCASLCLSGYIDSNRVCVADCTATDGRYQVLTVNALQIKQCTGCKYYQVSVTYTGNNELATVFVCTVLSSCTFQLINGQKVQCATSCDQFYQHPFAAYSGGSVATCQAVCSASYGFVSAGQCVANCPATQVFVVQAVTANGYTAAAQQVCVDQCPAGQWALSQPLTVAKCMATCTPLYREFRALGSQRTKYCAASCAMKAYKTNVFEKDCLSDTDDCLYFTVDTAYPYNKQCSTSCAAGQLLVPAGRTYSGALSYQCSPACPGSTPFGNVDGKCTVQCASKQFTQVADVLACAVCSTTASTKYLKKTVINGLPDHYLCVAACDILIQATMYCAALEEVGTTANCMYLNEAGDECTSTCTGLLVASGSQVKCVSACAAGLFNYRNQCQATCQPDMFAATGKCYETCSELDLVVSASGLACVVLTSCSYAYLGQCISSCPAGAAVSGQLCTPNLAAEKLSPVVENVQVQLAVVQWAAVAGGVLLLVGAVVGLVFAARGVKSVRYENVK